MSSVGIAKSYAAGSESALRTSPSVPAAFIRPTVTIADIARRTPEEVRAFIFVTIIGSPSEVVAQAEQRGNAKAYTDLMMAYLGRLRDLRRLGGSEFNDINIAFNNAWRSLEKAAAKFASEASRPAPAEERERDLNIAIGIGGRIGDVLANMILGVRAIDEPGQLQLFVDNSLFYYIRVQTDGIMNLTTGV